MIIIMCVWRPWSSFTMHIFGMAFEKIKRSHRKPSSKNVPCGVCANVFVGVSAYVWFRYLHKAGYACVSNLIHPEKRCQHCVVSVKSRLCGTRDQPAKYFCVFRESCCCVDGHLVDWLLVLGDPSSGVQESLNRFLTTRLFAGLRCASLPSSTLLLLSSTSFHSRGP